jgi:hypothetical protein
MMGWSIGYDHNWRRDIGYDVPALCDHPKCRAEIDRGLSFVCGGEPYGEPHGCGLFFCDAHRISVEKRNGDVVRVCPRCAAHKPAYKHPKADVPEWVRHKLTDESWQSWRDENPILVSLYAAVLGATP